MSTKAERDEWERLSFIVSDHYAETNAVRTSDILRVCAAVPALLADVKRMEAKIALHRIMIDEMKEQGLDIDDGQCWTGRVRLPDGSRPMVDEILATYQKLGAFETLMREAIGYLASYHEADAFGDRLLAILESIKVTP